MKKIICLLISIVMALGMLPAIALAESEVVYLLRDVNDGSATEVAMSKYKTYQTEHFQIFYDTDGANSHLVTAEFLATCEAVLENCWALFIDKMGMEPTSTSVLPNGDHTTQYKTNVVLMGTGVDHYYLDANGWGAYGAVDTAGYPYFMCCIAAMSSPTTVAHEFGHAVHYAQGDNAWENNIYLGPWFEAVANWFAEQYIYEYDTTVLLDTELSPLYLRATHLTKMNGRAYYEAWPLLQYLEEDPDNTGVYGTGFVQKLLSCDMGDTNVLFWEVLDKVNGDVSLSDTIGAYASHMATMDFKNKANYNNKINYYLAARTLFWQQRYTMLEKLGEVENTYAVPTERAPQAMGYNIIPLDVSGEELTVTLNGLTDASGAHWTGRVVLETDGVTSYSELFNEGESVSVNVKDADEVYLTVAATPDVDTIARHTIGGWAEHSTESNFPYEDKTIYPYSVTLSNATPQTRSLTSLGMMTKHPNGGGRKSFSAKVADTAYIGPNAIVFGNATVSDNAVIDGYAVVGGNAVVKDNAYVGDYAVVFDRAEISGNAQVVENACIYVDYKVGGNAVVKGSSLGLYDGSVTGEAITYGDWFEDMSYDISGGSFSGYHSISSDTNYSPLVIDGKNVRGYVPQLRARYEFEGNLRDTVAYSDAYGVNKIQLSDGYVSFDGEGYVVLNESVLNYNDVKITLSAQGEGDVLTLGDITLTMGEGKIQMKTSDVVVETEQAEGFNEIEITLNGKVISLNGETAVCETTLLEAVREGESYLGYNFTGDVDYLRVYDMSAQSLVANTGDLDAVFEADNSTGGLAANGANTSSAWYGWSGASGVTVDKGLNITGIVTGSITSPGYETDTFVIEFEPSGGKAYPDHGILDVDGSVLFAHRYATDANAIHVGRGEINSSVRGSSYVTDTTNQQRLTNFAAEKLYSGSIRSDRGAVGYENGNTVRIIAENTRWGERLEAVFEAAENKSSVLDGLDYGDDVYLVTYALVDGDLEVPVSVSVYKGSFEGFGGFKVAGGANSASVSYKNLKVYVYNAPVVECDGEAVTAVGIKGSAVAVFAKYEGDTLTDVAVIAMEENAAKIPQGFENSTVMILTGTDRLTPLTESLVITEE